MKKLIISAIALLLIFSVQTSAQIKVGATAGMNFNTAKFTELQTSPKAGWNAGLTLLVDLPLGLSIQPSVVYSQKTTVIANGIDQVTNYIDIPVSLQWGPDLLIFRPFLDATPFIGYALSSKTQLVEDLKDTVNTKDLSNKGLQYGLGLGGGINVWKLQVVARYCWNFGLLQNLNDFKEHLNSEELVTTDKNFGGLMVNVAFFF